MRKILLGNKILLIVTSLINVVLLISVFFLMNHVQKMLYTDVQKNLTEIVTQNKDVIISKFNVEMNNLKITANQLSDRLEQEDNVTDNKLQTIVQEFDKWDKKLYFASKTGNAFFTDGNHVNIAGRNYFLVSLSGESNISERIISRKDGIDIFVISLPLYVKGKIEGAVQKWYTPEEFYEICSLSLFSQQGYMYIIQSDGTIVITTQESDVNLEKDNYFRRIYLLGNKDASMFLENEIKNNRSGSLETIIEKNKIFSAFTPLDGVHDWYLITSVSMEAVSANTNNVIKIFYCILLFVVIVAAASLILFFLYKNKQQTILENIAFLDPITNGNTFNKFSMNLKNLLQQNEDTNYALISFDIDNFKYINSYFGFDHGDFILKTIYQEVLSELKSTECLARVSGDRFVALLEDYSIERINQLITIRQTDPNLAIYISAGLYVINNKDESINLMLDKASTAAQSIKGVLNKEVVVYSDKFENEIAQNEQLKRGLEIALQDKEIIPYYQPKINIDTGKIVGAEALARWITKEGGMISPGEFIPLSEKTGQIVKIDLCIFEQVLCFLKECIEQNISCVPISVNFSRLHLKNPEFIHQIVTMIDEYHVPRNLIQVEITESIIFGNNNIILDFVNHLHDHGIVICIDDFGSGYSSLNMLKDIPVDVIKIDKAFLDLTKDINRQQLILSSITRMAKDLNMEIVVEGVETQENVDFMKIIECNIAQGFYFARPMKKEDIIKVLIEGVV